jgi:hypothetical protein
MAALSVISTMNVERPPARSSAAPIRVKIWSSGPRRAALAGTNEPTCAISAMSATWRMYVDLPPMLGPVISNSRRVGDRRVSLAMKLSICASTTGWRPPSISTRRSSTKCGRT